MPQGRIPTSKDGKPKFRAQVAWPVELNVTIDKFLRDHKTPFIKYRNDLIELALRFYLEKFEEAGGDVDRQGFPKHVEPGSRAAPLERKPKQK